MFSPYNFLQNIDKPQVRKPDTHGLIKIFNESKINNIVSENYGMFEHYIENAYKNFNQKLLKKFKNIQFPVKYKKKKSNFIIKNDFTNKTVNDGIKNILLEIA